MKIVDQSFEIMNTSGMSMVKIIELCARNCYKSEDGITATSAMNMVRTLIANNHLPALEFGVMHFEVRASIDRMQEFIQLDLQDQYKYVVFSKIDKQGGVPVFLITLSLRTLIMCFRNGLKSMVAVDMCHFISHIVGAQIGDPMNLCVRLVDESEFDKYEDGHDMDLRRFVYVRIITNRAVTHELVRHRPASYLQECLSGNTIVKSYYGGREWKIKDLYNYQSDQRVGRFQLLRLKGVLEDGRIIPVKIKRIIKTGTHKVFRVVTKSGRSICATDTHRFLTPDGWKTLKEIGVGDVVMANGVPATIDREFIKGKYLDENMERKKLASMLNISDAWLGKLIARFGLQKPKNKYPNRRPGHGVKGMFSEQMVKNMSIRQTGINNSNYKGDNCIRGNLRAFRLFDLSDKLCSCGKNKAKERHHIDRNSNNNDPSNIEFLCVTCHKARHFEQVRISFKDEILSVTECEKEMTYDIEIDHPCHNFVANGLVVHNSQRYCNYSLGKFDREVTFIRPSAFFQEPSPEYSIWLRAMARTEDYYLRALDYGATPQAARTMLPNSCKTEIIALASIAEWKHIFKLRTSPAAEPSMQEIMKPIADEFTKRGLI